MYDLKDEISCLILNYNDCKTTLQLVEKLNLYKIIKYIVIVDNCSTDDSFEKLLKISNNRVHVIKSDCNGGYGYGNNFGIKYIYEKLLCKYALICNPDISITEQCIIHLKNSMVANNDWVLIAPVQKLQSSNGKIVLPWKLGSVFEMVLSMSLLFSKVFKINLAYDIKEFEGKNVFECDVLQGALLFANVYFMYNKGQYDENIFLYNEEECLAHKIKDNKKKSILLCDEIYIHEHSVSIDKNYKSHVAKKKLQLRSRLTYLENYYSIGRVKKIFIKMFFCYCKFEAILYQIIKG